MSEFRVEIPQPGDNSSAVVIVEWGVTPGTAVSVGDELLVVETDKANLSITSPVTGTVRELLADVDAELLPGAEVCVIDT